MTGDISEMMIVGEAVYVVIEVIQSSMTDKRGEKHYFKGEEIRKSKQIVWLSMMSGDLYLNQLHKILDIC